MEFLKHILLNENTIASAIINGAVSIFIYWKNKRDIDGVAEAVPTVRATDRMYRKAKKEVQAKKADK